VTAQYLLRFDDLCPTMDGYQWRRFVPLLRRFGIRPILAVVPDNQDPELRLCAPDPGFWAEMREWQAAGATIGLHGYQHVCEAGGRGLVPLHAKTEFAGVPLQCQRDWIRAGLEILAGHGLTAMVWVAPRHGLDWGTVKALREQGIGVVSDGFARRPFREGGAIWIPQQLWGPVEKKFGLWTICLHANSATDEAVRELEVFLERFAEQFTCVDRVLDEWAIEGRSVVDRMFQARMLTRIRLGRLRRQFGLQ
jgi:predicted deacetylase